ncbi:MAG: type II toxin-antitoxin system HicB family antitoxin [Candidatus Eremiobacteraeota bacterium]|nr:type II toxin-antitoxin system HicB family antitoxin [Candidatus Eremiobacteraeota bacterium]
MKVCVVYERSKTGWSAYPPGLPGVAAVGQSIAEVRKDVERAIEMHIADMTVDELVEHDTPGEFAELLDVGPAISEEAHRELLRRNGIAV